MSCDRSKVSVGNRESLYKYPSKYDNIKKYILSVYRITLKTHSVFLRSGYAIVSFLTRKGNKKLS